MRRSHYPPVAVLLVTLLAFAVRAASLDTQSLWRDEVDALCYAYRFPFLTLQSLTGRPVSGLHTPCACPPPPFPVPQPTETRINRLTHVVEGMVRQNGPLYFFLLRGWIALTGTREYSLRYLAHLFGVLTVPLTYVLGRRLMSRRVGLFAALLMALSPYQVWYGQEVKMYTLVSALALLALYGLQRALECGEKRWWATVVVATSLAFYSHILAALLIPVEIACYFLWWPPARRQWRGALLGLVLLTLPYLPLLLWQLPLVVRVRETGFAYYPLPNMALILLGGWSMGIGGLGNPWGAWPTTGLAAVGLLFRQENANVRRAGALLATWLLLPLLTLWLISLRQPLFTDRYLIWTAPAFYLLVAGGLETIWARLPWGAWGAIALLGVLLTVDGANLTLQATVPLKTDFRAAAQYVAQGGPSPPSVSRPPRYRLYLPLIMAGQRGPQRELIIFQIPHGRYPFDYYFPSSYSWAAGPYTNYRDATGAYVLDRRSVSLQMEEMVRGQETVWLVYSEPAMWDERDLARTWLNEHLQPEDEAHFYGVDVYRYRKREPTLK